MAHHKHTTTMCHSIVPSCICLFQSFNKDFAANTTKFCKRYSSRQLIGETIQVCVSTAPIAPCLTIWKAYFLVTVDESSFACRSGRSNVTFCTGGRATRLQILKLQATLSEIVHIYPSAVLLPSPSMLEDHKMEVQVQMASVAYRAIFWLPTMLSILLVAQAYPSWTQKMLRSEKMLSLTVAAQGKQTGQSTWMLFQKVELWAYTDHLSVSSHSTCG